MGKYGPGQPVDFGAERVTRSVAESMERLDVDYIDVILVHDVEYADDLQQVLCSNYDQSCIYVISDAGVSISLHGVASFLSLHFRCHGNSSAITLADH